MLTEGVEVEMIWCLLVQRNHILHLEKWQISCGLLLWCLQIICSGSDFFLCTFCTVTCSCSTGSCMMWHFCSRIIYLGSFYCRYYSVLCYNQNDYFQSQWYISIRFKIIVFAANRRKTMGGGGYGWELILSSIFHMVKYRVQTIQSSIKNTTFSDSAFDHRPLLKRVHRADWTRTVNAPFM